MNGSFWSAETIRKNNIFSGPKRTGARVFGRHLFPHWKRRVVMKMNESWNKRVHFFTCAVFVKTTWCCFLQNKIEHEVVATNKMKNLLLRLVEESPDTFDTAGQQGHGVASWHCEFRVTNVQEKEFSPNFQNAFLSTRRQKWTYWKFETNFLAFLSALWLKGNLQACEGFMLGPCNLQIGVPWLG